jgi:CSLREA domain-containing protein
VRGIPAQLLSAFALILFLSSPAFSATINVTANATDTLNGANGQCSLREAITNINNATGTYNDCTATGSYGTSDTINIPAGTYTTTLAGLEDLNATGDYDILKSVSIVGAGASTTIINGGGLDKAFQIIWTYTVSISGVTITGGGMVYGGGGIYNDGTLTITNSTGIICQATLPAGSLEPGICKTKTLCWAH